MKAISLKDFYRKIEKGNINEKVAVKNPYTEVGAYEILEPLGPAGNGYIFLAVMDDKKQVAIRISYYKNDFKENVETVKVLMGEDYKKYLLEPIDSSRLLKYIFLGNELLFFDKDIFISTWEPADATLNTKLEERFETKWEWFIQFLKGLRAMHAINRIHFDLKLENLFLLNNRLKIADFDFYSKKEDFLQAGPLVVGTPGYIAPELFYGRESVSAKCDIFSAGVAFCQLFTGSKLPDELLKKSSELMDAEEHDIQPLFGDRHLEIKDTNLWPLFIKNYRVFNFFKHEVMMKLDSERLFPKEYKVLKLLLTMIEIDPENRPDAQKLLFKVHEIEFDPELFIGKKLQGRYIVQELIDGEGRGIVYKVWDPIEETVRAIKLFPPQFNYIKDGFDQIKNELRYIPHRNIVDCFGLQKEGDFNFILLEYIKGVNLKEKLAAVKGNKLKEHEALVIMRQVASGLIEAHRNGVIHRNLKDTNIMVTAEDNRVKIINFGLSLKMKKEISETTGQDVLSSASLLFSPPEYLEKIWRGDNAQIDVWGFGAILYQLLMGKPPFDENDFLRDPAAIPAITSVVSEKTKNVIFKCLEKERQKRFRNMEEVYHALFEEQSNKDNQKPGKEEENKRIPGFSQYCKKKWFMGFIFILIAASLWLILGTNLITRGKKYEMWYSGKPGNIDIPGGGIGYAVSFDGIQWERDKNNPVITQGSKGSFNEFESGQPFLVNDGQYFHMLFSGSIKTGNGFDNQIGYARFENITKWERKIEKVILDNGKIKFPGPLLCMGDYYKMWYSENDAVFYASTTIEGQSILKMERYTDNPVLSKGNPDEWDQDGVIVGSVLFENGKYRMWYTGKSGSESKIGYAASGDGITWNKYPENPVFDDQDITLEMNPCVIHDEKGYKMYYTAATAGIEYYPVRLATSTDGIKWEKYSNPQVLDTGSADWEKAKIFVTSIIYSDK